VCRLTLTSFDQMPEEFEKFCYLEFTQPATAESYTVLRSVSINEGSGRERLYVLPKKNQSRSSNRTKNER
jgi:hypothetical protein